MAGGVCVGRGVGVGIDVRDLERAMAGFVAGHLASAEGGVGRHHVQAGVVRSAVGSRLLPGGAEGIRTSDLRGAAWASPPAAGSCSAASSTPFPRGSLAGGCGSASTRIGSSLPHRKPISSPRCAGDPSRAAAAAAARPSTTAMPGALIGLAYRDAATPRLRPSLGRAPHATAGEESLPHHASSPGLDGGGRSPAKPVCGGRVFTAPTRRWYHR